MFTTIKSASAWVWKMASSYSIGLFLAFLWWPWCRRNNMVLRDTSVTKIILNIIIFMHYDMETQYIQKQKQVGTQLLSR